MKEALVVINKRYVDPLEASEVAQEGVKGMVNSLDPHSTYIPADQADDVKDQYQGSFGGIGIVFEVPEDTARVISPVAGGPSEDVGVMAGDRIVKIEGASAVGMGSNEIQNSLKGEVGTKVQMTIYRPTLDEQRTFTLTREKIETQSVRSSYMVDEKTGYINVTRFTMKTHEEFQEASKKLLDRGMERLVLDLRGNPGGVMRTSWQIANEMLGEQMTIVETKGRSDRMNREINAKPGGLLREEPIIVLVDRGSASASEILSGALQDHDRAFLVGRRTFGKGLIQKQYDLGDESVLQMTVGRYYTPVGRLIQSPYERGGDRENYYEEKFSTINEATYHLNEYRESIPDSLAYETDHGRTVFGGGGFETSEDMLDQFWSFAEKNSDITITQDPDSVNAAEQIYSERTAQKEEGFVATRIKGYMARLLYGRGVARPILNQADPVFQEAISLWPSSRELAAYHSAAPRSTVREN
ncbi:MAG: S41 family peptidase [Bacteroidetes bacterium QH_2_64_26]|nr:MAG: S41 family peptidase [Bacteroidetes bacterium QH_2_64_26]